MRVDVKIAPDFVKSAAAVTMIGAATRSDRRRDETASNFHGTIFHVRIEAKIGKPFRGIVATFVDLNPLAPLSDYTVRINWGDGRTTFGTARKTRSGRVVTGTHTWGGPGIKRMTITIIDEGGSRAVANSRARVT